MELTNEKIATLNIQSLLNCRDKTWEEVINSSSLVSLILSKNFDKRLYAIYMIETYHYVIHNPRHQALVAVHANNQPVNYLKFCYEHAEEETGHELMALHDLETLGYNSKDVINLKPLPDTTTLISYLYWISTSGNPLQRLGYSYWAEDSYGYIGNILDTIRTVLNLKDSQMTFFVAHSNIDEEHAKEVEKMIETFVKTEDDWLSIKEVMETSLKLQKAMMDSVFDEYKKLLNSEPSRYAFLNDTSKFN